MHLNHAGARLGFPPRHFATRRPESDPGPQLPNPARLDPKASCPGLFGQKGKTHIHGSSRPPGQAELPLEEGSSLQASPEVANGLAALPDAEDTGPVGPTTVRSRGEGGGDDDRAGDVDDRVASEDADESDSESA